MASTAPRISPPAAQRLTARPLPKPWGRHDLGPWGAVLAGPRGSDAIGEIHHHLDDADDPPLLFKTLFTAERLSVQVHPDAAAARRLGLARGKDEAWVVLAADPGAAIGLGLRSACDAATLRAAALDGSIVDRMIWHPCAAGDVFLTPAGTIHAIGAGVTLFEIQQNLDLTYRLHDYGRPRELHLDQALAVADLSAWAPPPPLSCIDAGRALLVEGPSFVLERLEFVGGGTITPAPDRPVWAAVVGGDAAILGESLVPGDVWHLTGPVTVTGAGQLLLAYPGAEALPTLWG